MGYGEAKFLRDFTFRASVSLDQTFQDRNAYRNNQTGRYRTAGGAMFRSQWNYTNVNSLQTLNWGHDWGKHHVDAVLGHEYNWVRWTTQNFRSSQGLVPGLNNYANFISVNTGATYSETGGNEQAQALEGYFLRANYNFDNRYLFSGSLRADGSSKFRYTKNRWGLFWSVGGAWRISEESWAKDARWLDDLKLRVSYGVIGNQSGIGSYSGYQTWSYRGTSYPASGSGQASASAFSIVMNDAVNQNLTWEKVHNLDVGVDFRLWDRFYGTVVWYQRETKDMLWSTPLAQEMGQASLLSNAAEMRTRGIEIDLGVDIIRNEDFQWSVNMNGTHYKTILTKVPESEGSAELGGMWTAGTDAWGAAGYGAGGTPVYLRGVNKPYYNAYMIKYMGVNPETGMATFSHIVNQNDITNNTYPGASIGDVVATPYHNQASRVEIGDVTPKFIGGFGTYFAYKNLDLSVQLAFQIGGKFFSNNYAYLGLYHSERIGRAVSSEMWSNSYSPSNNPVYSNVNAKFPMSMPNNPNGQSRYESGAETANGYTDLSLFNASYLSIKNITVGYNFPQRWMDAIGIGGIRAYASLDNMWFFTTVSGIDPRMDITGGFNVGAGAYPYMRSASIGLNITF